MSSLGASLIGLPLAKKLALGAHGLLAAYLAVNGVGHQAHVLWKARAGTLRAANDLSGLLGIGAGLLVAAALVSWSIAPLTAVEPRVLPAVLAIAALGGIVTAIGVRYGATFLGGTITLATLDLIALGLFAIARTSA